MQLKIRDAVQADLPKILQFIKDLAEYEKAPNEVVLSISDLEQSLFGTNPQVYCLIAELENEVTGFAVWHLNYSTWLGKPGIYLEDLFVQPEYRGHGIGKGFMKTLAQLCIERGYERFQWWVLDWNEPSIDFYESLGAVAMDEWTVFRLSGGALKKFANEG